MDKISYLFSIHKLSPSTETKVDFILNLHTHLMYLEQLESHRTYKLSGKLKGDKISGIFIKGTSLNNNGK